MRSFTADFGAAYSGLATVGVTQLRPDGTVAVARTNAGVTDFGNGVYGAEIDVDPTCAVLRWDSGTTPLRCAIEDVSILPTASFGGSKILDAPNSPLANSFIRVLKDTLPGGTLGKNGVVDFQIELINHGAAAATVCVYLSGSPIYAAVFFSGTTVMTFSIANRNSTQAQMSTGYLLSNVLCSVCNTDVDLPLEVYILKATVADDVSLRRFTYQIYRNDETRAEASYLATSGVKQVFESDLLLPVLPPRVTGDPQKTIRSLAASDYRFPDGFFCVASQTWPIAADSLPVPTSLVRTVEWYGAGWVSMQTAQATAAYAPVTGPAPAGISAVGLAIIDKIFAAAHASGVTPTVSVMADGGVATPAWVAALGGGWWPLSIPATDPNRAAMLASIGYYTRYIVQRYTTMYPEMTWYIQPVEEPVGYWSGVVADFVALIGTMKAEVTNFGGGKVFMLSPSHGTADLTYLNSYSSGHGTLKPTMQECLENGGWDQFDVLSLHSYYGGFAIADLMLSNLYSYQGLFYHDLKLFDPEMNISGNGKFIMLPAMLSRLYPNFPGIVPGVGVAGKPVWVTECGESYVVTRDKTFYIRLALIASALGVTKYTFFYFDSLRSALTTMDIENRKDEFIAAHNFLSGKTINFVNVNDDFSKVGAGIDGQVYLF